MRIGNWLRWFGDLVAARFDELDGQCSRRRERHSDSSGRIDRWAVRRSLLRSLRADAIRRRADGKIVGGPGGRAQGPRRRAEGQRPGNRHRSAGLVHVQSRRGQEAIQGRDHVRSSRPEHQEAVELLLLADQGRLDSRALGRRQRARRHGDDSAGQRRPVCARAGQLYSAGRRHRPGRGPTGCSQTLPAAGDDATWFPNLYDDLYLDRPRQGERRPDHPVCRPRRRCSKYDQLFRTSARQWEAAFSQNKDISRWPGHCLGGAVASILLERAGACPWSGMTQDELKALWAELGENHYNHRIGDYANEIPPGPPRPGPDECDWKAPRVHAMFETHIRGEQKAAPGQPAGLPAPRHDQRGLEPRRLQVHRDLLGDPRPRPARGQHLARAPRQLGLDAQRPGRQGPGHQL